MFYGKPASELQTGVEVGETGITGTLHYVTDYTGFSGDTEKQSGNYLALTFDATEGATLSVTLNKAQTTTSPIVLEPDDRNCVFRISDKSTQTITVKVEHGDQVVEKTYALSGLTLEPKPEVDELVL